MYIKWAKGTWGNAVDIRVKECATHTMIRFAGEYCPVCKREELIVAAEELNLALQDRVASLEMLRATAAAE